MRDIELFELCRPGEVKKEIRNELEWIHREQDSLFFFFKISGVDSALQKWITLSPLFMICFGLTARISDYLVSAATAFSLKKQKNSFV